MLLNSLSAVVTLVENDELAAVNDPLILLAICAEPLINVLLSSDSAVVTLVLNEPESDVILDAKLEDTVVTEPLMLAAVKVLINEALDPNDPLISLAI